MGAEDRTTERTVWAVSNHQAAAEHVASTVDTIDALEHELACYVGLLRQGGWSWARVGEAVGMTRQGAQQRYKHAAATLAQLENDALVHPEAAELLGLLQRRLSVRMVRERWEVRTAGGELISKHYVEARAAEAARRAGEGATYELAKLRDNTRVGSLVCRGCGELHCACVTGHAEPVEQVEQVEPLAEREPEAPF